MSGPGAPVFRARPGTPARRPRAPRLLLAGAVVLALGLLVPPERDDPPPRLDPDRYTAASGTADDGAPVWVETPGMAPAPGERNGPVPADREEADAPLVMGPLVGQPLDVLRAAAAAAHRTTWHGTQQVTAYDGGDARTVTVEIAHTAGGTTLATAPGGGPPTSVYEPEATPAGAGGSAAPFDTRSLWMLARNYDLTLVGHDAVAGRPSTLVRADRHDGVLRVRVWIDDATGLVLRREDRDGTGRLVRSSALQRLVVGSSDGGGASAGAGAGSAPAAQDNAVLTLAGLHRLRADGWAAPALLPGGFGLYDARVLRGSDPAVHLSYTDGVSTLSLFEEPGRLDPAALRGWVGHRLAGDDVWFDSDAASRAEPAQCTWASRGVVYTLVADGPLADLAPVTAALPHGQPERDVWDRLRHGATRVASWFNPFR